MWGVNVLRQNKLFVYIWSWYLEIPRTVNIVKQGLAMLELWNINWGHTPYFQGFCCFSSNAHRWNHWDFPRHLLFCLKWPLVVIELYQSICCFLSWTVSALRQIFLCGCCSIEVLWEDDFPKASTHDWRLKLMLQDN